MNMLTSTRNPRVQWLKSLQTRTKARREAGAFVVEGIRLSEEALAAGLRPKLGLYSDDLGERGKKVVDHLRAQDVSLQKATTQVMKAAGATETPQGILLVLPMYSLPLPPDPHFILILDAVRDPGNLGTILRTASGAGAQAVLLTPGSVDLYAPKVIRSAMGAHFRLPVHHLSWMEINEYLFRPGAATRLEVYLADVGGGVPYTQVNYRSPLALIIGGEAEGAGPDAHRIASQRVHIPMAGKTESLNAGIAAALLMFEVVKQRSTIET
jgi:RNA methyltransferase, TrmH family